ncbi:hypothetical protein Pcinc_044085 [Petrolisthes cinctipes]|uniref:Uncharacterized protein n=1 Tax=Petrolisthes cinctipes TaxID=88211 RepID=A0AAE1EFL1_PETCI|nr:hypothetical protein Pcinc_044085 [Petrolisthes cinctipes]
MRKVGHGKEGRGSCGVSVVVSQYSPRVHQPKAQLPAANAPYYTLLAADTTEGEPSLVLETPGARAEHERFTSTTQRSHKHREQQLGETQAGSGGYGRTGGMEASWGVKYSLFLPVNETSLAEVAGVRSLTYGCWFVVEGWDDGHHRPLPRSTNTPNNPDTTSISQPRSSPPLSTPPSTPNPPKSPPISRVPPKLSPRPVSGHIIPPVTPPLATPASPASRCNCCFHQGCQPFPYSLRPGSSAAGREGGRGGTMKGCGRKGGKAAEDGGESGASLAGSLLHPELPNPFPLQPSPSLSSRPIHTPLKTPHLKLEEE